MKKIIPLLLILVSVSFSYGISNLGLRARVGITIASAYTTNNKTEPTDFTGFALGMGISKQIKKTKLFFQPELMFVRKGFKFSYGDRNRYDAAVNLDYIEIPILIAMKHDSGLFFTTGPFVGFHIDSNTESDNLKVAWVIGGGNDFGKADYGLVLGIGYEANELMIETRYDLGVSQISEDDNFKVNTKAFLIMLGLKF